MWCVFRSEERKPEPGAPKQELRVVYVLLVITAVYIIFSLYLIFKTRSRLTASESAQQATIAKLVQCERQTQTELNASSDALAQRMGMTQQDLQQFRIPP